MFLSTKLGNYKNPANTNQGLLYHFLTTFLWMHPWRINTLVLTHWVVLNFWLSAQLTYGRCLFKSWVGPSFITGKLFWEGISTSDTNFDCHFLDYFYKISINTDIFFVLNKYGIKIDFNVKYLCKILSLQNWLLGIKFLILGKS